MTYSQRRLSLFVLLMFIVGLSGCMTDANDEVPIAQGEVRFQLLDSNTREPFADTEVNLHTLFEGDEEEIDRGPTPTDEEGVIEGYILTGTEETIIRFIFTLQLDGETYRVEEDAELELRFNEPLDSISREVLIDISPESAESAE